MYMMMIIHLRILVLNRIKKLNQISSEKAKKLS